MRSVAGCCGHPCQLCLGSTQRKNIRRIKLEMRCSAFCVRCNDGRVLAIALFHQLEEDVGLLRFQIQISTFVDKCSAEHFVTNVKLPEMWS
jgi:hypothetical protein